jgi:hypothetical protein
MKIELKEGGLGEYLLSESRGATEKEKLENILKEFSIIKSDETLMAYSDIYPWKRGGAETYIACSNICVEKNKKLKERQFVAKAVVREIGDLNQICAELMERRRKLMEKGAPVSNVYTVYKATIFEEFLPMSAEEALASGKNKEQLLQDLEVITKAVTALGGKADKMLTDIRSDGKHLYFDDYGEDLGGLK